MVTARLEEVTPEQVVEAGALIMGFVSTPMAPEKLITYIIDNGHVYSDHALYFVQAPKDFGEWLEEVLVPWLKARDMRGDRLTVVGTCESVKWARDVQSMSLEQFLNDDCVVEELDYGETPPDHRPRYRGAL